jgi:hypothetical protein
MPTIAALEQTPTLTIAQADTVCRHHSTTLADYRRQTRTSGAVVTAALLRWLGY